MQSTASMRKSKLSSFTYLNITQLLSALNDNAFRFFTIYFCLNVLGSQHSASIIAITGMIFVIPFLVLSPTAGALADRFSKRNIIVLTKVAEVFITGIAVIAFALQSTVAAYVVLLLMASQSALFNPSKYGIIPELVEAENITRANGLLSCLSFVAIVVGTFLASLITDMTGRNFVFGALLCAGIAVVEVFASYCISYTPPAGSRKKLNPWFVLEVYRTFKQAKAYPGLMAAMIASAYSLFLGGFVQFNLVPFAIESLGLSDVQGGYLCLLSSLGIGLGAMVSGRLSGKGIELALAPLGGLGMTLCSFLLGWHHPSLTLVLVMIAGIGFFGGIFLVPLDAFIQVASPKQIRGQIVAATNFFSFLSLFLASISIYIMEGLLGLSAGTGFLFLGVVTLLMTLALSACYYDYLTRFFAMIAAHLHFKMSVQGQEHVSLQVPSLFFCVHTAWYDLLLMLGSQRMRVRFFSERCEEDKGWSHRLYGLLKSVPVPSMELVDLSPKTMQQIMDTLNKGISVCLLLDEDCYEQERGRLTKVFQDFLNETPYNLVSVAIEKDDSRPRPHPLVRFITRKRIAASVSFCAD